MAQIIENSNGRRTVRLTSYDVLAIVSRYQQQFHRAPAESYEDMIRRIEQEPYFLPEDRLMATDNPIGK